MKKFIYLIIALVNAAVTAVYINMSPLELVPTHYNVGGIADIYSSKWTMMYLPVILVFFGLAYTIYCIIAEHTGYQKNRKYIDKAIFAMFLMFFVLFWILTVICIEGIYYIGNLLTNFTPIIIGPFIIFLSNIFPKFKQNGIFGIRTAATLSSEAVWKKTHKLGGYCGVVGGILMMICGIAGIAMNIGGFWALFIGLGFYLVIGVIVPCVYASVIYRREKKDTAKD